MPATAETTREEIRITIVDVLALLLVVEETLSKASHRMGALAEKLDPDEPELAAMARAIEEHIGNIESNSQDPTLEHARWLVQRMLIEQRGEGAVDELLSTKS